jgi:NO-binding membrane sensor protein with MHYT domain
VTTLSLLAAAVALVALDACATAAPKVLPCTEPLTVLPCFIAAPHYRRMTCFDWRQQSAFYEPLCLEASFSWP